MSSVCCFYLYLHFLSFAAACFKLSKFGHSKRKTWLLLIILQPLHSKALSVTASPLSNKWQTCHPPPSRPMFSWSFSFVMCLKSSRFLEPGFGALFSVWHTWRWRCSSNMPPQFSGPSRSWDWSNSLFTCCSEQIWLDSYAPLICPYPGILNKLLGLPFRETTKNKAVLH